MNSAIYHDDLPYEILDGKQVYWLSSPTPMHNFVAENIHSIFKTYLAGKPFRSCLVPTDVRFSETDIAIPDVLICNRSLITDKWIDGAPELIVEIRSPSTSFRDLGYKKDLYEKHGVKEYWIVDPRIYEIQVYTLCDGCYELSGVYTHYTAADIETMTDDDRNAVVSVFTSPIFSDLTVSLADVFNDIEI